MVGGEREKERREKLVWFGLDCLVVILFGWAVLACALVRIFSPNSFFYLSAEPVEKAMRREYTYHHTRQDSPTKQHNKKTRQEQDNETTRQQEEQDNKIQDNKTRTRQRDNKTTRRTRQQANKTLRQQDNNKTTTRQ